MATYTVRRGDSLWAIAEKLWGDGSRWRELYRANKDIIGGDPGLIYPGQEFTIPGTESEKETTSQPKSQPEPEPAPKPKPAPKPAPKPKPKPKPKPSGPTPEQRDAKAQINDVLAAYGLDGLSDWAWNQIQKGRSQAEIMQSLRERPEYQARFPGIKSRVDNGYGAISEAEYIQYEDAVKNLMRSANMPERFWDQPQDFADLISNNVSVQNLAERIEKGYKAVAFAPEEVKGVFRKYFGVNSDSAMAAFFLDPDKAETVLMDAAEAAVIGGTGVRFGLEISREQAERLDRIGVTKAQAEQGFAQVRSFDPAFRETVSEKVDLTAEGEGVSAFLENDPDALNRIRKRVEERQAAFSGGGGAAFSSQQGVIGLGTAQ